jgi:hypothetical protein
MIACVPWPPSADGAYLTSSSEILDFHHVHTCKICVNKP